MKLVTVLLMMAVAISCMAGCGSTHTAEGYQPPAHNEGNDNTDSADTVEPGTEVPGGGSETEIPADEADDPDISMDSVEAIAAIGDLVGNYSEKATLLTSVVDIDNDHNPYDLTWAYGEEPDNKELSSEEIREFMADPEWSALYDSYIDACDWSLVFDIDYYMEQFPVLAYLYQYDEDLLLEHFQTTGVHEGRQGIESFNVAAYMANCDQELIDAFGGNYECYYFYWMLNQDTESTVVTTDANAPVYLTVQLSYYQNEELKNINAYREEVGADPVAPDPELIAFASYRAWHDAKNAIRAHDSINNPETKQCMDMMDIAYYSENTVKYQYPNSKSRNTITTPYRSYRNSESHYKAMVNDMYIYTGVTNVYLSEYTARTLTQFDLFAPYVPLTSRENAAPDISMDSVEAVAAIGDLVGNYSQFVTLHNAVIDIDNDHNPYDLTWAYGEKPERDMPMADKLELIMSPEWSALYNSYVDACDWSLVFDIDYYMDQFPVLAYQYQYDENLLLEHYQTTGVHEGRQGIESFNVAAYMKNCDQALRDAFGDNYECYYFYWMLNQDTEQSVVTTDTNAPVYLTVQLSYYQNEEYEHINAYREEVGADPVALDPEMVAFAGCRAWYDAKNAIEAHDSIYDDWVANCMRMMGLTHYSENTTKYQYPASRNFHTIRTPYSSFRYSEDHYKAMVADQYIYAGVTNVYLSEYTARTLTYFDLYTNTVPVTSR